MYLCPYLDGRLSLLQKDKSYREVYHSHLSPTSQESPQKKGDKEQDSLAKLLRSRRFSQKSHSTNPELEGRMKVFTEVKLDSPRALKVAKYEGQMRIPTVLNDFHAYGSKAGFHRSETGGIFPK